MQTTDSGDATSVKTDAPIRLRLDVVDALMKAKGVVTKAEQARRFGFARTHWARIRNGDVDVTLNSAWKIAEVAGTSLETLFGRAA